MLIVFWLIRLVVMFNIHHHGFDSRMYFQLTQNCFDLQFYRAVGNSENQEKVYLFAESKLHIQGLQNQY